jgi:hypothetical protein
LLIPLGRDFFPAPFFSLSRLPFILPPLAVLRQMHNRALAQLCAVCSPFSHYGQNPCYGLTVATPSDSVMCGVESWLLQLKSSPSRDLPEQAFSYNLFRRAVSGALCMRLRRWEDDPGFTKGS